MALDCLEQTRSIYAMNVIEAYLKAHHAFKATAAVAYRFVHRDNTVAATPYENPSYRAPLPVAFGSGCHEFGQLVRETQLYRVSTVPSDTRSGQTLILPETVMGKIAKATGPSTYQTSPAVERCKYPG